MSKREKKSNKKIIKLIIIAIIIVIALPIVWYAISISPVDRNNDEQIEVTIPIDSGTRVIGRILADYGVIRNELAFSIYVRLSGQVEFQAGIYYFNQSMGLREIRDMLQTGRMYDPNQIDIIFREGINIRGLARIIERDTNNTADDVFELLADEEYIGSLIERFWFLTEEIRHEDIFYPLEGYLFPDTYTFRNADVTVEEIFERMLARTEQILNIYREEIESNSHTIHEIITIASILETEAVGGESARNVASIIYNRLAINMALEMDPTTYYGLRLDPWERDLFMWEINTFNPYNTRGPNMGGRLPIGPIALVGRDTLQAALRPTNTNYLFFVSDSSRRLYFRETYSEHNAIIQELRAQGIWFNDIR